MRRKLFFFYFFYIYIIPRYSLISTYFFILSNYISTLILLFLTIIEMLYNFFNLKNKKHLHYLPYNTVTLVEFNHEIRMDWWGSIVWFFEGNSGKINTEIILIATLQTLTWDFHLVRVLVHFYEVIGFFFSFSLNQIRKWVHY